MSKSNIVRSLSNTYPNVKENDVGVLKKENPNGTSDVFFVKIKQTITVKNSDFEAIHHGDFGDLKDNKICNVCHRILPATHFDKNQNGKDNRPVRRPSCKDCRKVIDGENMSSADKRKWALSKPHLSEFTCPICKKTTIPGLTSKVVLNHDHTTGKVYGWICDSCNTGLGRFKDDIDVLKEAIKYLESHQ